MRRLGAERGSGSVLGIALAASLVMGVALSLPLYMALSARQSAIGAADSAALAAVDVALGTAPGLPCSTAARVAAANGAVQTSCEMDGTVITVSVSCTVLGLRVVARSTAGPGPAVPN